jgi:hypothetical protein
MQRNSDKRRRDSRSIDMAAIIAVVGSRHRGICGFKRSFEGEHVADSDRNDRTVVRAAVFKAPEAIRRGLGVAGCLRPLREDRQDS